MIGLNIDERQFLSNVEKYITNQKKYRAIVGTLLNILAYKARNFAIKKGMGKNFTIRSKGLLRKHFMFTRTRTTLPIDQQQAYYGSIASKRFTGWIEQQTGKRTQRERTATPAARGRTGKRVIPKKFRHNLLNNMPRRELFSVRNKKSDAHQIYVMLAILARRGYRGSLYIGEQADGKGRFPAGIYQMLNKKTKDKHGVHWNTVRPVQLDRELQPDRVDWANEMQRDFFGSINLAKETAAAIHRVMSHK
jgi:hypothetical protein